MEYYANIAGVNLIIVSELNIEISNETKQFICEEAVLDRRIPRIQIKVKNSKISLPEEHIFTGEDLLYEYYRLHGSFVMTLKGGRKGYIAYVREEIDDKSDLIDYECFVDLDNYKLRKIDFSFLYRALPIPKIMSNFGIIQMHSSRVLLNGKALLFSGPSQIGKSTHANLLADILSSKILSNDRTFIAPSPVGSVDSFVTYSSPLDGSNPVAGNHIAPLGYIVILDRSDNNTPVRLSGVRAVQEVMNNLIVPSCVPELMNNCLLSVVNLVKSIPIIYYPCTKEKESITCLLEFLNKEDG